MTTIEKKLDRIISILERIESKLNDGHVSAFTTDKEKPVIEMPIYKKVPSITEIGEKFIQNHNRKIDRAIKKGKKGLPLTNREQIIYQLHLEKEKGSK